MMFTVAEKSKKRRRLIQDTLSANLFATIQKKIRICSTPPLLRRASGMCFASNPTGRGLGVVFSAVSQSERLPGVFVFC